MPAGAKALSGQLLKEAVTWTFTTPTPRVVRAALYPDARRRHDRILPDDGWALVFNLIVDPAALASAVTVTAGGKAVPVDLSRLGADPKAVMVKPRAPLPVGVDVLLTVAPGWRSAEGPVPSSTPYAHKAQGYRPLSGSATCDDERVGTSTTCWPMSTSHHDGLRLDFSGCPRRTCCPP
jgi:hypothetical protein